MGTLETRSGAPLSPEVRDYAPSEMELEVLSVLEEMAGMSARQRVLRDLLASYFEKMLAKSLAIGCHVRTRDITSPAYNARVVSGRSFRQVYRIEGPFHVVVNVARPEWSKWTADAISTDGQRDLGNTLTLEGDVFPHLKIGAHKNPHAYIVQQVAKFEASK